MPSARQPSRGSGPGPWTKSCRPGGSCRRQAGRRSAGAATLPVDLVLRRIRSLKRCAQACGCKIMTPRYAQQFGSRLHFKRCQALRKETSFPLFLGPLFWDPFFLVFCFCSLEMQPGAKLQAYLGVIILQPHPCTQRFRLRILRRTRSFPGRTSARSLSGRIESIWETPSKEKAWSTRR